LLASSAAVNGPYTEPASYTVNTVTKTITVPVPVGGVQFYRIVADGAKTITSTSVVGPNVVITYTP